MDSNKLQYKLETVSELRQLKRGDQIAVQCWMMNVEYYHFGIYLGAEKGVAEFGDKYLRVSDLFVFKGDKKLYRAVYSPGQCLADNEMVAKTAEDIVKSSNGWGTYHLTKKNCEHFATYCKTGTEFSQQVKGETLVGMICIKVIEGSWDSSRSLSASSGSSS